MTDISELDALSHEAVAGLHLEWVVEQASCSIFVKDPEGRYLAANRRFLKTTGLSREQVIGARDEDIFPPDQAAIYRQSDLRVLRERKPILVEEPARHHGGDHVLLLRKFPVLDARGEVTAVAGIITDNRERHSAMEALSEVEERFRLFMDNGPAIAWIRDEGGRYVYANSVFERRFGLSAGAWLGKSPQQLLPPAVAASFGADDADLRQGESVSEVIEHKADTGGAEAAPVNWLVVRFPFRSRRGEPFRAGVALDISTRVQLEHALRQRAERFILPALGSRIGIYDLDLRTWKAHLSAGWAQIQGLADEPLDWTWEQVRERIHPEDVERVLAAILAHADGSTQVCEEQYRMRHVDGSWRWVWSRGLSQRDESGRPSRLLGSVIDITEHRQALERERAQQRLTAAIAQTQDRFLSETSAGESSLDLLKHLLTLTESTFGFIGEVLPDEAGRRRLRKLATCDITRGALADIPNGAATGVAEGEALCAQVIASGKPFMANDLPSATPAWPGSPTVRNLLALPLHKAGALLGVVCILNRPGGYDDALVTYLEPFLATAANMLAAFRSERARRAAESALRESEERYRQLVETSPDAVYVHQDGRFVFANKSALAMLGLTDARGLDGLSPFDLFEERVQALARSRTQRILAEGWVAPPMEARLHALDGTVKDVEMAASRIDYRGRPAVQAVMRDMTERKRLHERELRSRRLESLGTLAGGVAHDFNNILTAIQVNLSLALDDLHRPESARQSLDQAMAASQRAATLVHQILSFSRSNSEKREPVDLGAVLEEVLAMLRATVPAYIDLRPHMAPGVPAVSASSSQVHQVVVNLVTNAIHAIGRRPGHIDVDLRHCISSDAAGNAGQVRLRIADDGCGMDEHTRERIFDPFFTTKAPGEGVGLGLSIVHEIMRTHGGHVEVSSAVGKGTVFELYFPVSPPAVVSTQAPPNLAPPASTRILFVDDDPLINFAMERLLTKAGYVTSAETSPQRALERFRADPGRFDVLIVDMAMPGMSGMELARTARACRGGVPIILASGNFEPADEAAARELGITQFLAKPYDLARVESAVATARSAR